MNIINLTRSGEAPGIRRVINHECISLIQDHVSGFHHPFKAVTALIPLQFQKRLRLQEARRLMLGENLDAAVQPTGWDITMPLISTGSTKDLPMRDVERLRETTVEEPIRSG